MKNKGGVKVAFSGTLKSNRASTGLPLVRSPARLAGALDAPVFAIGSLDLDLLPA